MDIGDVDVYSFVHLLYEKRNEIEENFRFHIILIEYKSLYGVRGIAINSVIFFAQLFSVSYIRTL